MCIREKVSFNKRWSLIIMYYDKMVHEMGSLKCMCRLPGCSCLDGEVGENTKVTINSFASFINHNLTHIISRNKLSLLCFN